MIPSKMSYKSALMKSFTINEPSTNTALEQKASISKNPKVYKDLSATICSNCNINYAPLPKDWRGLVHRTFTTKPYGIEFIVGKSRHTTIISGTGEYNIKFNGNNITYNREEHKCDDPSSETFISSLIEDRDYELMTELASITKRVERLADAVKNKKK